MTRRSITLPPPENDHLIVAPNDKPTSGTCTVCKKKVRLTPISTCCFHPGLGARKCDGSFEFPQEHECNQEEEKPKMTDIKEEPKSPKEVKDLPRGTTVTQLPPEPQPKQHKMYKFKLIRNFEGILEVYHLDDDNNYRYVGDSTTTDVWDTQSHLGRLFGFKNIEVVIEKE